MYLSYTYGGVAVKTSLPKRHLNFEVHFEFIDSISIYIINTFLTFSRLQTQGHAKFALSPQGSNVGNQVIDSQILGFPEFQRDKPLNEIGKLNEHNGEDNLQCLKSSMVMTETPHSSSSVLDFSVNSNSSKVLDESSLSAAFQSSSIQPLAFAEEMALQVEENQDKVDSDPKLPLNMVEPKQNASSVSVNNALATKIELDAISSDVLFGESAREGLYMFYEENKSATGSMTPLNSLKSLSPRASIMNGKGLPSAIGNNTLKGLGLSTDISLESTGNYNMKENALDIISLMI